MPPVGGWLEEDPELASLLGDRCEACETLFYYTLFQEIIFQENDTYKCVRFMGMLIPPSK